MKQNKAVFKKHFNNAMNKVFALDEWAKKGLLSVDTDVPNITINYLIWHTFSNKGLIKLMRALTFYLDMKRSEKELPPFERDVLIKVDYGQEVNQYHKIGVVDMVLFCKTEGFKEV
ncbi:hypothetical protein [uncultured Bacteroides sp.]|uniref:hypothetical protein n=1 Tax=uncultured Bacteroides sp. TaxID=162156 RepID=UPI002AAAF2B2|nr:hypothetical protein [uncultured Bacteroides sp.]